MEQNCFSPLVLSTNKCQQEHLLYLYVVVATNALPLAGVKEPNGSHPSRRRSCTTGRNVQTRLKGHST